MTRERPRHAQHARVATLLRRVLHFAVPMVVVTGIAATAYALRAAEPPRASVPTGSTADVAAEPDSTAAPEQPRTQHAERSRLRSASRTLRAQAVRGIVIKRIPPVPEGWVKVDVRQTEPTPFTVATYNVLGAGHTGKGGNKGKYADGVTRIRWAAQQLTGHGVTVAGLQEFQLPQAAGFAAAMPGWQAYPGGAGGRQGTQNSIVWNTSVWSVVQTSTTAVPYFGGVRMPMPYVLLEHATTGQRVWFANFHNPADAHGPAERWRDLATSLQIGLFNRLRAEHPLVVTGDMNEREEYLCRVGSAAGMHAANGGYADGAGCHYQNPLPVDWILGSPTVEFSGYVKDESAWQQRTSDHPLYVSQAQLQAQFDLRSCQRRYDLPAHQRWCPPPG